MNTHKQINTIMMNIINKYYITFNLQVVHDSLYTHAGISLTHDSALEVQYGHRYNCKTNKYNPKEIVYKNRVEGTLIATCKFIAYLHSSCLFS